MKQNQCYRTQGERGPNAQQTHCKPQTIEHIYVLIHTQQIQLLITRIFFTSYLIISSHLGLPLWGKPKPYAVQERKPGLGHSLICIDLFPLLC